MHAHLEGRQQGCPGNRAPGHSSHSTWKGQVHRPDCSSGCGTGPAESRLGRLSLLLCYRHALQQAVTVTFCAKTLKSPWLCTSCTAGFWSSPYTSAFPTSGHKVRLSLSSLRLQWSPGPYQTLPPHSCLLFLDRGDSKRQELCPEPLKHNPFSLVCLTCWGGGIHIKTTGCLFGIPRMPLLSQLWLCLSHQETSAYAEGTGSHNHRVIQVQPGVEED